MLLRRRGFLTLCVPPLLGDEREDALRILEPLVAALADGQWQPFLSAIDRSMPDYSTLTENIQALVAQAEIASSVTLLAAAKDQFEVDWIMSLRGRRDTARIERRRERVRVDVAKKKIRSLSPISFFAPMGAYRL